jgi:glutamate-1-semialdehyde 2,1-aminomutase
MHQRKRSFDIYEKLCEVIPGGVNSPVRSCKGMGQPPMVAERGEKDKVYDVDGNSYIDYCCSWGALIHGHTHPQILEAAQKRMWMGSTFGITTEIEEKLARKIVELMPSIEKIRFVSTGTEATMSAVRLARGFTKRSLIVKFAGNYHGHADFFLVQAGSGVFGMCPESTSAGIPTDLVKHTLCLSYNDIEACLKVFKEQGHQIAGVILEPIVGNMGCIPATPQFIQMLREQTTKCGALLIFDEVMTGFRVALGGAQQIYHVKPDLTTLAKIIGGGFPAAAFGGRRDIMDLLAPLGPVYQGGTLSGNPVAMEAGLQALMMLEVPGFYQELERKTRIVTDKVSKEIKEKKITACIQAVGSMITLFFGKTSVSNMEDVKELDFDRFAEFFRFMFSRGVYIPPLQQEAWFISMAHEDGNLKYTADLIIEFLSSKKNDCEDANHPLSAIVR